MDSQRREIKEGGLFIRGDPVAAVVMCAPQQAAYTMVNGRFVVKDGRLTTIDLGAVVEEPSRIARRMVVGD